MDQQEKPTKFLYLPQAKNDHFIIGGADDRPDASVPGSEPEPGPSAAIPAAPSRWRAPDGLCPERGQTPGWDSPDRKKRQRKCAWKQLCPPENWMRC